MLSHRPRDLDYFALTKSARRLDPAQCAQTVRLALLGDAATQQFVPLLKALFHGSGVHAEIYEGSFDGIELDVRNPASSLYAFAPDVVVLLNAVQALRARFYDRAGDATDFQEKTLAGAVSVWDALRRHSPALVLQTNYVLPVERFFGNYDHKLATSFYSVVAALNAGLARAARDQSNVLINDAEGLASYVGRKHWFDERLWALAKSYAALPCLPLVANNVVDLVLAARGRLVKCVVLDLDNTLWGGIVGDDGVDGIELSAHGDGEAFHLFQCYLRELRRRGILLAVCSKNDPHAARLPFREHPDMVLREEDITVFQANWDNKAENLKKIREVLNIGFDAMVFLDDNPFERNLVRELVPGVIVPELPEDPANYARALSELNLFEATAFTKEDHHRGDLYKQEALRRELETQAPTFEEFLRSLDMRLRICRFDASHLPRIAQLIQRSNQFNLTTRRHTQEDCARVMLDTQHVLALYAQLIDKFGDHGLIAVVMVELGAEELMITDWLMSCRVLKRGVEQALMTFVVRSARERGVASVAGEYVPTAKNGMVRDFYAQFGFEQVGEDAVGKVRWRLRVADYQPTEVFVQELIADEIVA